MSIMKEGGNTMATKKMNMGGYADGGMPMKNGKPAFIGDGKGMKKGGSTGNGITTAKMGAVKSGGFKGKGEHAIQSKGLSKGTMISMKGSKPLGMKKGGKAC
jgi:hypothetical protein